MFNFARLKSTLQSGVNRFIKRQPKPTPAPPVTVVVPEEEPLSEEERVQIGTECMRELRRGLSGAFWWGHVQDEIKAKIDKILDNIVVVGPLFRDAFICSYRYEHARRVIEGESLPEHVPGALFGKAMPEESYQCGIKPVKSVLNLNDWVEPNDADVQACMVICHKVDEMQRKGVIIMPKANTPAWTTKKVQIAAMPQS